MYAGKHAISVLHADTRQYCLVQSRSACLHTSKVLLNEDDATPDLTPAREHVYTCKQAVYMRVNREHDVIYSTSPTTHDAVLCWLVHECSLTTKFNTCMRELDRSHKLPEPMTRLNQARLLPNTVGFHLAGDIE